MRFLLLNLLYRMQNYLICSAVLYEILSCVHAVRSISDLLYQVSSIRLCLLTTAFPRIMISLISNQDRSRIVVGMVIQPKEITKFYASGEAHHRLKERPFK